MEEKKESPTEIYSFYAISKLQTNNFDLNKKRKLSAEQLGLPLPKHKQSDKSFPSEYVFPYGGQPEKGGIEIHTPKGNADGVYFCEGSEAESAEDSNSFNEESDSATSVFGEAKDEPERSMACTYDSSSNELLRCGDASSKSIQHFHDGSTAMEVVCCTKQELAFASVETAHPRHNDRLDRMQKLDEHLLEFENHELYNCAEYEINDIDQCTEKEIDDLLHSSELNPTSFILSSGRWKVVNQEAQSEGRKPTIDQEFEEYFSMLML